MYLEFIGLSGVGKTEIIKKCFQKKEIDLVDEFDLVKLSKPKYLLAFIAALFLLLRISTISFKSAIYLATSKAGLKLLLSLGSRKFSIARFSKKNNTLLVDSGVLMPFIESVMVDDLLWDESLIKSILSIMPLPDVIIHVYTNENLSYQRFINRSYTKYSCSGKMDGVYITRFKFSKANKCLLFILKHLEMKSIKIVHYNNKQQIDCQVLGDDIKSIIG
jgi:hypothetical protein